jgi:hypothetical protein
MAAEFEATLPRSVDAPRLACQAPSSGYHMVRTLDRRSLSVVRVVCRHGTITAGRTPGRLRWSVRTANLFRVLARIVHVCFDVCDDGA